MNSENILSAISPKKMFGEVIHNVGQLNPLALGFGSCCCSCSCSAAVFVSDEKAN